MHLVKFWSFPDETIKRRVTSITKSSRITLFRYIIASVLTSCVTQSTVTIYLIEIFNYIVHIFWQNILQSHTLIRLKHCDAKNFERF